MSAAYNFWIRDPSDHWYQTLTPNSCARAPRSAPNSLPFWRSGKGCAAGKRRVPSAVPFKNRPRRDYVSQKALPARYVTFPAKRPLGQKKVEAAAAAVAVVAAKATGAAGARGGGPRSLSLGPSCAPRPGAWTGRGHRRASVSAFSRRRE